MNKKNKHMGSSFESFLKDEGNYEDVTAIAVKRVLAFQLREAMEKQRLSKSQMAKQMSTSRTQLDRVLDPGNPRIQLDTIIKAAKVVGRSLKIEFV